MVDRFSRAKAKPRMKKKTMRGEGAGGGGGEGGNYIGCPETAVSSVSKVI